MVEKKSFVDLYVFLQLTYFAVEAASRDLFDLLGEGGAAGGEGRSQPPPYILAFLLVFAPGL